MRRVAVFVVLALVLVGCGGSDGDADSPSATTTTTIEGGSAAPTTQAIQTPTTQADNGNGSGGDFSPETCPALMNWANDSVMASQAAFSGGGTNSAGAEFSADYFQAFADQAPDEIAGDMQVFADAYNAFFTALEDMGIDFSDPSAFAGMTAAQAQELEAVAELMGSDAVNEAGDNIEAFFEDVCGG